MKKKKVTLIIGILLTICITIGVSYALWRTSTKQEGINSLSTSCIKLDMEDLSEGISLEKAYPLTDEAGAKTTPYKFKVKNTCNTGIDYNVNIEVLETSTIASKNIAAKLDSEDKVVLIEDNSTDLIGSSEYQAKEAYHISKGSLDPNESKEHEIRIWMDESAGNDAQKGTFSAKVVISGVQNDYAIYKEPLLHGADPVLDENGELVPVIIEDDGKVLRANEHFNWYSYEDKEWANAVILVDKTQTYEYYQEIPESNIESYFVWIPKYRYKLFDMGNYSTTSTSVDNTKQSKAIEIEFGLEDTIDNETNEKYKQCATPMNEEKTQGLSGESKNCHLDDWMTHPAFISFNVNGLWVGKFETGYKNANSTAAAQQNNSTSANIVIKPDQYSWRNLTIGNSYTASLNYKKDLLSHNMKNTEWGAVAYLTQSIYGRCTSNTSCTEVTINSNTSYKTGYNTTFAYPQSKDASTTGNNTGIFDMNGGTFEQMASVMANNIGSSTPSWSFSGLSSINDKRYYDLYTYSNIVTDYRRRILGDATGEMGPFQASSSDYINSYFGDYALFVYSTSSWFYRSGNNNNGERAGVFAFHLQTGTTNIYDGFRIALAPQEIKE